MAKETEALPKERDVARLLRDFAPVLTCSASHPSPSTYLLYRRLPAPAQPHEKDSRFAVGGCRAVLDVALLFSIAEIFGKRIRYPVTVRQRCLVLDRHVDPPPQPR